MKKYVLISIISLLILTLGCIDGDTNGTDDTNGDTEFTDFGLISFAYGECGEAVGDYVGNIRDIEQESNNLIIEVTTTHNCCPTEDLEGTATLEDDTITLTVTEPGIGECDCVCPFDSTFTVGPLAPGDYTVELYDEDTKQDTEEVTI